MNEKAKLTHGLKLFLQPIYLALSLQEIQLNVFKQAMITLRAMVK